MWYKILLSILAISIIIMLQVTWLGSFGQYWSGFNLILATLVILIFLTDFSRIIFFVIIAGILLDIYSSLPFGVFLLSLFVAAVSCEIVFLNFLTNRSFYSVMLMGLVALMSFHVTFLIVSGFFHLVGLSNFYVNGKYFVTLLYQLINTLISLSIMFSIVNSLSKKFKPNFLRS
jgi:hypothetical protein